MVIIWIYALIRPKFDSSIKTVLATSFIFLALVYLVLANLANLGMFPIKLLLFSLVLNLIELPVALWAGATVYEMGEQKV